MAMQASLAESTMMPWMRSSSRTLAVNGGKHRGAMRRRPALTPRVLADGEFIVELEAALLDFVEHEFERHELGEARRRDQLIAILLEQNAVAFGIEQDGVGNGDLKGLVLFGGHVRGGVSDDNGGEQTGHDSTQSPPPRQTRRPACNNASSLSERRRSMLVQTCARNRARAKGTVRKRENDARRKFTSQSIEAAPVQKLVGAVHSAWRVA